MNGEREKDKLFGEPFLITDTILVDKIPFNIECYAIIKYERENSNQKQFINS
jgi:hypothetical protein